MDQATQILLGGVTAQALFTRPLGRWAGVVGGTAGLIPDLDMAFQGLADPAFPMEVHRTFSHSVVAMPVGAALTTILFMAVPSLRARWKAVFGAAVVAWLTHAPLDACTSYGTMLLWPFSKTWFAWDLVAIIDPLFSLVLLVGFIVAMKRRHATPAAVAFAICLAYLGLGWVQKGRALDAQERLIAARGDTAIHQRVMPQLGGIVFWRSLYLTDTDIHADHIRLTSQVQAYVDEEGSTPRFTPDDLPDTLPDDEAARAVFGRYYAFTDGFAARVPREGLEDVVGDMRYCITAGFDPVWGVRVVQGERPLWVQTAQVGERDVGTLVRTVLGLDGSFEPLPVVEGKARGEVD